MIFFLIFSEISVILLRKVLAVYKKVVPLQWFFQSNNKMVFMIPVMM